MTAPDSRWVRRPVPAPPTVDEAAQALAHAEGGLQQWQDDAADRTRVAEVAAAELAEAEAIAGDAAFEAPGNLEQLGADLVRRRTELEVSHRAATAAQGRVDDARRALLHARAGDATARATQLREVAATRQARTDQMLAELNGYERTTYVPGDHTVPLTRLLVMRADWLDGQAADLLGRADSATAEQLAALAARPAIPQSDHEAEALASAPVAAV